MSGSHNRSSGGVSIPTIILVVFIILKLTGNIDWSWWWVLSPLWIVLAALFLLLVFIGVVAVLDRR